MQDENPYAPPKGLEPSNRFAGLDANHGGVLRVLSIGWQLFRRHFLVILGCVAVVWLPLELLSSYLDYYVFGDDFRRSFQFAQFSANFIGIIATGAVISIGATASSGATPSIRSALIEGVKSWPQLFWTRLIAGLAVLLALLFFIIPGIYVWIRLSLVESIAVIEPLSGTRAIRRSWELTRGQFWYVLGVWATMGGVLVAMLSAIFLVTFAILLVPDMDYWFLDAATSFMLDLGMAYITLCYYLAYRERSRRADAATGEESTVPAADVGEHESIG